MSLHKKTKLNWAISTQVKTCIIQKAAGIKVTCTDKQMFLHMQTQLKWPVVTQVTLKASIIQNMQEVSKKGERPVWLSGESEEGASDDAMRMTSRPLSRMHGGGEEASIGCPREGRWGVPAQWPSLTFRRWRQQLLCSINRQMQG